jgi:hypothetical protein
LTVYPYAVSDFEMDLVRALFDVNYVFGAIDMVHPWLDSLTLSSKNFGTNSQKILSMALSVLNIRVVELLIFKARTISHLLAVPVVYHFFSGEAIRRHVGARQVVGETLKSRPRAWLWIGAK